MTSGTNGGAYAKPKPAKPKKVKVRMAYGPRGGKVRPWTVGPPLLSKAYRLCDCVTVVDADDAAVLLAGGAALSGRVFIKDGDPIPRPKGA